MHYLLQIASLYTKHLIIVKTEAYECKEHLRVNYCFQPLQSLPSFNFREVKSYLSVRNGFLIQIPAISPDKRGHIIP